LPTSASVTGSIHTPANFVIHKVSQNPYQAIHPLKKLGWHLNETLRFVPTGRGFSPEELEEIKQDFLPNIQDLLDRHPYEVSGGQLLRFSILLGVLRRPDVMLADEPTASLDDRTSLEIARLLVKAADTSNSALVVATHDPAIALVVSREAILIKEGSLVAAGSTQQVLETYESSMGIAQEVPTPFEVELQPQLLIRYKGVTIKHSKRQREPVLKEVNLEVSNASRILLTGRSGAGKSTLLRSFFDKRIPLGGSFSFPISGNAKTRAAGRNLGVVFQDTWSSLNPKLTIAKILIEAVGKESHITEKGLFPMLDSAGLSEAILGKLPTQLSGGQRQRVSIVRSVISKPNLLILDEPTSHLDPVSASQVVDLLRVSTVSGTGLVVSSHKSQEFDGLYNERFDVELGRLEKRF
jgi:ABC-type dipeptide/oligopeptide/nickel transport system ATPase subunit